MKAYSYWSYSPYIPAGQYKTAKTPYISSIEPGINSVRLEWLYAENASLTYGIRGKEEKTVLNAEGSGIFIDALESESDYEFRLENKNGSCLRLARTGFVPGKVINYLHPEDEIYDFSGRYLCSPSIVKLPGGRLISSMDVYKNKAPQNLSILFESRNGGESWHYLTELFPCFWGTMFWHKDALYMLATSTEYGDLLIGRSYDFGKTWSVPTVIMRGSCSCFENGFHKAPMPVINSAGRLWTAVEYGSWTKLEYKNCVASVDEDADLLVAENWNISEPLAHNTKWEGAVDVRGGAIEGNIIEAPDGTLINMLRYSQNLALQLKVNKENPDAPLEFLRVVDFPMAHSKFEVRQKDGIYYAVGNRLPKRNILSLYTSKDLISWDFVRDIINFKEMDISEVGFQYPAFTFDGDDLLVLSRTAFNKANNFHDSNYQTFHRLGL